MIQLPKGLSYLLAVIATTFSFSGLVNAETTPSSPSITLSDILTIYKSPSCNCCDRWAKHLKNNNFQIQLQETHKLNTIKQKYAINSELKSYTNQTF